MRSHWQYIYVYVRVWAHECDVYDLSKTIDIGQERISIEEM